jgi:hypothetical protein
MGRTQSTRKKQGFAPATPGGDEPMARNTSAYFNVSRGDRPQAAMPQSYFDTSSSGQAPTSKKRDPMSPLRHSRSHGGADDPLSALGVDRPDGRYAQSGIGEKYFTNAGLGRSTSVRDPTKQQPHVASNVNGPKARESSGRHRSASPRFSRSMSPSSSSSESSDVDAWAAKPRTANHRLSKESNNSDVRTRPAVKDFGGAKPFFDGSGRYGPRESKPEPELPQSHTRFSPTQENTNGSQQQHMRFGSRTQVPPPPPYPPRKDDIEPRPLEKSRSWHDPDSPTRARNDMTADEPSSARSQKSPNMYGIPSQSFSFSARSTAKWSDQWPFSSKKASGVSAPSLPYWAYPSSVMPPSTAPGWSSSQVSPSKRKASSHQQTAKKQNTWKHKVSFLFDTTHPSGSSPFATPTDPHGPLRFTTPSGDAGFGRSPPPEFKSYSSENLSTAFNSADWDGTFNGSNEFFVPKPNDGKRAFRAGSSPTRGKQPGKNSIQSTANPLGLNKDTSAADEAQMPTAGAQSSFAPFSPAKFSAEEWAEKLKFSSSAEPSTGTSQAHGAATSRPRSPRRPSRLSIKRPSVARPATAGDDADNLQRPSESNTTEDSGDLDGGPMDIDPKATPPNSVDQTTSLPNATDQSPFTKTRSPYVEADRQEWHGDAGRRFPSAKTGHASRPSQSKTSTPTAAPRPAEAHLNLNNLNNVAPFAASKDGLEGTSDLKASLPFKSQASNVLPRPEAKPPVIPNPPRGPVTPKVVNDNSFERYIAEMGAYMYEWNRYNKIMLQHFGARQIDIETNLSSTWMSSVGDGFMADGKKGYADYMQAVEEDAKIRMHWEVSWEKHQETMRGLGRTREKMKSLKNGNGVMAAA